MKSNSTAKMNRWWILLSIVALLLLLASLVFRFYGIDGLQSYEQKKQKLSALGFFLFEQPRLLPATPLVNIDAPKAAEKSFNQHVDGWRIVNFGYMYCPDICPINLSLLSDVKNQWAENHVQNNQGQRMVDINVVHVTFDPERDTPTLLKQYLNYMNPAFYGLTGDINNIRKIAQAFNTIFIHEKPDSDGHYFITHSDSMALVNPKGEYVGMFKGPYQKDKMIKTLELLING